MQQGTHMQQHVALPQCHMSKNKELPEVDARAEPITFVNTNLLHCGLNTEIPGLWHIVFKVRGASIVWGLRISER
eukprot:1155815-Pelagomonas_calceolata.AAC.3